MDQTKKPLNVDLVSNGFKLLTNVGEVNEGSGQDDRYVYCAGKTTSIWTVWITVQRLALNTQDWINRKSSIGNGN